MPCAAEHEVQGVNTRAQLAQVSAVMQADAARQGDGRRRHARRARNGFFLRRHQARAGRGDRAATWCSAPASRSPTASPFAASATSKAPGSSERAVIGPVRPAAAGDRPSPRTPTSAISSRSRKRRSARAPRPIIWPTSAMPTWGPGPTSAPAPSPATTTASANM